MNWLRAKVIKSPIDSKSVTDESVIKCITIRTI